MSRLGILLHTYKAPNKVSSFLLRRAQWQHCQYKVGDSALPIAVEVFSPVSCVATICMIA